jgi:putative tryptophan/tyrosine transport system substrate-binding protein
MDLRQRRRQALAFAAAALAGIVLTGLAAAGPPGHTVRVGILAIIPPTFDPSVNPNAREFVAGLRELGYTPGQDIVFEYKSAQGDVKVLPQLAAELLSSKPDVIVTTVLDQLLSSKQDVIVTPALGTTLPAAKATTTVPIVMVGVTDVVETGIIASLARPGGNITGLAINAAEIAAKRVQLLQDAVPHLSRVAVLWNATNPGMVLGFQNIEKASPRLGVTIQSVRVTGSDEFDRAFGAIEKNRPDGLVVLYGPMRGDDLPRIVEFVKQRKLPTIFELGRGVRGGGLMEFGSNYLHMFRRAAFYVDKIANGATPADLPVEEPSRFELVINLKAAKSMGIEIPYPLLMRADRVLE